LLCVVVTPTSITRVWYCGAVTAGVLSAGAEALDVRLMAFLFWVFVEETGIAATFWLLSSNSKSVMSSGMRLMISASRIDLGTRSMSAVVSSAFARSWPFWASSCLSCSIS